jgi:CheY-like chemotaxis protein
MTRLMLVADDDTRVIRYFESLSSDLDIKVASAMEGVESVRKFDQESPDIVFLDSCLPNLDGFQVCRRLKETLSGRSTPVVILSDLFPKRASADKFIRHFGTTLFLQKPLNKGDVIDVLNHWEVQQEKEAALKVPRSTLSELDLRLMAPSEILAGAYRERLDGFIYFCSGADSAAIFFDEGEITFARHNNARRRLGALLLEKGRIGKIALEGAESGVVGAERFGQILKNAGYVKESDIADAVTDQIRSTLEAISFWKIGHAIVHKDKRPAVERYGPKAPTSMLLTRYLNRIRAKEARLRFAELMGNQEQASAFRVVSDYAKRLGVVSLSASDRAVLQLMDGRRPFERSSQLGSLGYIDIQPIVFRFLSLGVLESVRIDREPAAEEKQQGLDLVVEDGKSPFDLGEARKVLGDMKLASDVGEFDLVDAPKLCASIIMQGRTGVLRIPREGHPAGFFFRDGNLAGIETGQLESDLMTALLVGEIVPEESRDRLKEIFRDSSGRDLFAVLAEKGLIPEPDRASIESLYYRRVFLDLARLKKGTYSFEEAPPAGEGHLMTAGECMNILLEELRQGDTAGYRDHLYRANASLRVNPRLLEALPLLHVSDEERAVLGVLRNRLTLQEIVSGLYLTEDETLSAVRVFERLGAVEFDHDRPIPGTEVFISSQEKLDYPENYWKNLLPAVLGAQGPDTDSRLKMIKIQLIGTQGEYEKQLQQYQGDLYAVRDELKSKEEENEFLLSRLRKGESEIFQLEKEVETSRARLKELEAKVSETKVVLFERDKETERILAEKKELYARMAEATEGRMKDQEVTEQKLNQILKENSTLLDELRKSARKCRDLEEEKDTAQAGLAKLKAEFETLSKESRQAYEKLKSDFDFVEGERTRLTKVVDQFQSDMAAQEKNLVAELARQNELRASLSERDALIQRLKKDLEETKSLQVRLEEKEATLEKITRQLRHAGEAEGHLKAEVEHLKTKAEEKGKETEGIRAAGLSAEEQFKKELRLRDADRLRLEKKLEEKEREVRDLLEKSEVRAQKLEEKIGGAAESERNLRQQLVERQHEVAELKKELFVASSEREEATRENEEKIARLSTDLKNSRRQIEQQQQQAAALTQELKVRTDILEQKGGEASKAVDELLKAREYLNKSNNELEKLRRDFEVVKGEKARLEVVLKQKIDEAESFKKGFSDKKDDVDRLRGDAGLAAQKAGTLQAEVEGLKTREAQFRQLVEKNELLARQLQDKLESREAYIRELEKIAVQSSEPDAAQWKQLLLQKEKELQNMQSQLAQAKKSGQRMIGQMEQLKMLSTLAKKKDEELKAAQTMLARIEKMLETRDIQIIKLQKELDDMKKAAPIEGRKLEELKARPGAPRTEGTPAPKTEPQLLMLNEALARKSRQLLETDEKLKRQMSEAKAEKDRQEAEISALRRELERLKKPVDGGGTKG